jgi:hypothetical protein
MTRELADPIVSAYSQYALIDLDGAGFTGVVRSDSRYQVIWNFYFRRVAPKFHPLNCIHIDRQIPLINLARFDAEQQRVVNSLPESSIMAFCRVPLPSPETTLATVDSR